MELLTMPLLKSHNKIPLSTQLQNIKIQDYYSIIIQFHKEYSEIQTYLSIKKKKKKKKKKRDGDSLSEWSLLLNRLLK